MLGALELGKVPVKGAEGRMPAFAGKLENEHIGETHALVSPEFRHRSLDDILILDCQVLVVQQHFNRTGNLFPGPVVDRIQHP